MSQPTDPDLALPPQSQDRQPGLEAAMTPQPQSRMAAYRGAERLRGKVALVTGGDSGIADRTAQHGSGVPMGRPAQPNEIAPSYIFLASADAAYMTGQVLHPNGGSVVNG